MLHAWLLALVLASRRHLAFPRAELEVRGVVLQLRAQWLAELAEVRARIEAMRQGLAALDPALAFIGRQKGMFSTLKLSPDQVKAIREDHAVYMAGSGRINIAGLTPAKLAPLAAAVAAVR